ncbi:MAG: HlyC/CorC family transporter [Acidobacteria bacterium]|nr:MAG: HlyC/CorC family transporter [Acidobacteriota bacterium]REK07694.1 MAG: HlyC/CorC family transporter [Acidobacteriota bacterium]
MLELLTVIAIAIGVSALCSILEAVLLSISPTFVALLVERGERSGALLQRLRANIDEPISAILTLNTIAHTAGAFIAGAIAAKVLGERWLTLFSIVLTFLILVLSEIVPKTIGTKSWRQLARPSAFLLTFMVFVLKWLILPLRWISRLIGDLPKEGDFDRREIEMLARIGLQRGSLSEHEVRTVSNLLSLDVVKVSEVMTPRNEIVGLPIGSTLEQARRVFHDSGFSRLVVYDGELDDVRGTLTVAALLRAEDAGASELGDWLRPVMFIPATRTISSLLTGFRRADDAVAIVLDEFGSTKGLVTLHDLLEEIVGEIYEGSEGSEEPIQPLGRGRFRLAGRLALRELESRLDVRLEADADTVAGFVMDRLGRLAVVGDVVPIKDGRLIVEEVVERRIEQIVLERGVALKKSEKVASAAAIAEPTTESASEPVAGAAAEAASDPASDQEGPGRTVAE